MDKYVITCKSCKKHDQISIDNNRNILWTNNKYIVSGRYRLDSTWGFQCLCGNNNLLTKQEDKSITNKQSPDPVQVNRIASNPIHDKTNKFIMEKI